MKHSKIIAVLPLLAMTFLGGCSLSTLMNTKPPEYKNLRFLVESGNAIPGRTVLVKLPISGLTYNVLAEPLLVERNVLGVDLVKVALGYALVFNLDDAGTRYLYRASVVGRERHIVVFYDGQVLGARKLDGIITDGRLYVFVERLDSELNDLVLEMNENARVIQEYLVKSGKR